MKIPLLLIILTISYFSYGQQDRKISTVDFVQIVNGNSNEAIFYYQNNWQILRDMALENGYIESFQILETEATKEEPFNLMLITTYPNKEQYDLREEHFSLLIKEKGELKLMNDMTPNEFRKTLFRKEMVKHLN